MLLRQIPGEQMLQLSDPRNVSPLRAGLAGISVSNRAWEGLCKNPPYYLDLAAYKKSAADKPMETPYTPAVPLFLALREACLIIEEEGMSKPNRTSPENGFGRAGSSKNLGALTVPEDR